jgi:hypothetical protein
MELIEVTDSVALIMMKMRSIRFSAKSAPAAFAVVTLLAYGLLLPFTGFYWDDWPFAWIARFLGPSAFIPAFQGFRPFLGPIFLATTSILPPNPLLWQSFALLVRLVAALAAWFALNQVWPARRWQTCAAALLFLVFPAYSQHWVAYTHINQEWISFIAYLFSLGLSVRALRSGRSFLGLTALALLLEAIGLFPTEYFIGLEPVRFLFFWVMAVEVAQGFGPRLLESLKRWSPYLLVWLADIVWLVRYYRSGIYVSYDLTAAAAPPALNQALLVFGDALWKAGLYAWVQVTVLVARSMPSPASLLTILVVLVAFVMGAFYLLRLERHSESSTSSSSAAPQAAVPGPAPSDRWQFAAACVIIGAVGVLLGRVPSFAAGLPLTLQSSYDRFTISMMLGGSILVLGLVELTLAGSRGRAFTVAALLALGIGQQFFNANIFRRDWQRQTEIYWQFAWRVPGLQPGTAVITKQLPLDYETDLSMTAALNWIYARNPKPPDLPYAMVYSEKRLGGIVLPDLDLGTPMKLPFRTMEFEGNTSQAIVIYVPPNGCVRVLDPGLGDGMTYSRLPEAVTSLIPLSDPRLIIQEASSLPLPTPPFAREPAHGWCYYYEKAELARQAGDWKRIVQLGATASQKGLTPADPFEWLPYIEAGARAGDAGAAAQLTRQALELDAKLQRGLCVVWKRVQLDGPIKNQTLAATLLAELSCTQ